MATRKFPKDVDTSLVPYSELSRGKKQEIDLERRAKLAEAKKNAEPRTDEKAVSAYFNLNPIVSEKERNEALSLIADGQARRRKKLQDAQDLADYKDVKNTLYADDVPHKVAGDARLFKKGGAVKETRTATKTRIRGVGKATKGVRKAKVY